MTPKITKEEIMTNRSSCALLGIGEIVYADIFAAVAGESELN